MSEAPKQSIATTTTQMTQPDWMMNALQTGVNRAGTEMNRAPNSMYQSGMDNLMNVTNQWLNPSYNPTITQSPTFGGGNANLPSGLSGTSGGQSSYFNLDPATKQYQDTLAGKYLYGGEGLEAAQNAAMNKIIPNVTSAFNASGRMGGIAGQSELASRIGDSFAGLYDNERNRVMQALGQTEAMERAAYAPQQHNIDNAVLQLGQGLTEEQRLSGKVDDYLRQIQGPAQFVGGETKDVPIFEGGGSSTADILGAVLGGGGILSSILDGGGGINDIYQNAKKLFDDGSIGADVWDAVKKAFGFDDDGNITQIDPADFIGDTGNPANTVNTGPTTPKTPTIPNPTSLLPPDAAVNNIPDLGLGGVDPGVNVNDLNLGAPGSGFEGFGADLATGLAGDALSGLAPGFGVTGAATNALNIGGGVGAFEGFGAGLNLGTGIGTQGAGVATTGAAAGGAPAAGGGLLGGAPASAAPGGGLLGGSLGTAIGAGLPLAVVGAGQAYSAAKDAENRAWAAPYFEQAQGGNITTTDGVRGIPIQFNGETFIADPAIKENPEVGIGGAEGLIVYRPATKEYGLLHEGGSNFTSDIQTTLNELEEYAQQHGGKIYTRDDVTGPRIVRDPNNMSSFTMRSEADILRQEAPREEQRAQAEAAAQAAAAQAAAAQTAAAQAQAAAAQRAADFELRKLLREQEESVRRVAYDPDEDLD